LGCGTRQSLFWGAGDGRPMVRSAPRGTTRDRSAGPPRIEWPKHSRAVDRSVRFSHVRLELDAVHEGYRAERLSLLAPLTTLLHEREVESTEDLLQLTGQLLRALTGAGFRRVDHWEARPGGWLPLPEATHAQLAEPVSHLVRALSDEAWAPVGKAHSFAARLSGPDRLRVDLVVRRVHRERLHAVSLELWGTVPRRAVEDLVVRVHDVLPLVRAEVVAVETVRPRRS
ncbi:MAG: hypothetical protein L3K02_09565, partial [Thermoplasmata archaeon]|nr:hypothetical protein [Thermoplasmata archaeon]